MPEDVGEKPQTHNIAKTQTVNLGSISGDAVKEKGGFTHEISWDRITEASNQAVTRLKTKYPNVEESQIESVANLLFGPFRVDRRAMVDNVASTEARVERAKIQHNLVHGIFYAGSKDAGPAYSDSMYSIVSVMEKLADSTPGELNGLRAYWSGVRNELAIVKALIKDGYSVELPNYNQGDNTQAEQNEVLNWDVKNGIDIVASKPGEELLLIDAKGRNKYKTGYIRTLVHVNESSLGNVPNDIGERYKKLFEEGRVKRLEVIIPADKQFLSGLKPLSDKVKSRNALADFATSRFESDIIQRVKRPTRYIG